MDVDIVCVGFGPAVGGFLTTLSRHMLARNADPAFESRACPGMPLQVLCYERADDPAFGVSGVVTAGRSIRGSYPELDLNQIPMAAQVGTERVAYLMDPVGASRRSTGLRLADRALGIAGGALRVRDHAFELPWSPGFLHKTGGLVLSLGQCRG